MCSFLKRHMPSRYTLNVLSQGRVCNKCQKRPNIEPKETYYRGRVCKHMLSRYTLNVLSEGVHLNMCLCRYKEKKNREEKEGDRVEIELLCMCVRVCVYIGDRYIY